MSNILPFSVSGSTSFRCSIRLNLDKIVINDDRFDYPAGWYGHQRDDIWYLTGNYIGHFWIPENAVNKIKYRWTKYEGILDRLWFAVYAAFVNTKFEPGHEPFDRNHPVLRYRLTNSFFTFWICEHNIFPIAALIWQPVVLKTCYSNKLEFTERCGNTELSE